MVLLIRFAAFYMLIVLLCGTHAHSLSANLTSIRALTMLPKHISIQAIASTAEEWSGIDQWVDEDSLELDHGLDIDRTTHLRRQLKPKQKVDKSKLQRCRDSGEAYSASYLITKQHLLEQFTDYNLTWVN